LTIRWERRKRKRDKNHPLLPAPPRSPPSITTATDPPHLELALKLA